MIVAPEPTPLHTAHGSRTRLDRTLPVLGAFVVGAIAYGGLYTFPALVPAFATEFGISRTLTVTPWTMFLLVSGLASPLLGHAYDVFLDRQLLTAGMLLIAAGWLTAATAPDASILIAAYGIFLAIGLQLVFVGTSTAIARRYAGVAGLALGVAYAGPGLGVAIAIPLVAPVVDAVGWRAALGGFAVVALAGLPFVVLMTSGPPIVMPVRTPPAPLAGEAERSARRRSPIDLRIIGEGNGGLHEPSAPGAIGAAQEPTPPGRPTRSVTLRRTLRTRRFWVLFAGAAAIGTFDEGVYQAFLPHVTSRGVDAGLAARALGLQALAYIFGQIVGGAASDRLGRRVVGLASALAVAGGATAVFGATGDVPILAVAGIAVHGLGLGATIAVRSAAFSDVFGGHNFGAIFGILAIAYPIGGIAAVYAGGIGFDRLGSYWPVYGLVVAGLVVWSLALWVAGPRRHTAGVRHAG